MMGFGSNNDLLNCFPFSFCLKYILACILLQHTSVKPLKILFGSTSGSDLSILTEDMSVHVYSHVLRYVLAIMAVFPFVLLIVFLYIFA